MLPVIAGGVAARSPEASSMRPSLLARIVLFIPLAAPALAQNQVWIVAPGGPLDPPTDPQAIVEAADDGDVLLFETGNYPACEIDGKSLSLIEDTGAAVTVARLVVRDLQPDQVVLVSGLEVRSQPSSADPLVELLFNDGGVMFRDVVVHDEYSTVMGGEPEVALRVKDCASVALLDSLVTGRRNDESFGSFKGTSAPAIELDGSQLAVFGGQVLGADGLNAFDTFTTLQPATPGERAMVLKAGMLVLSGADVHGGHGGNGNSNIFGLCLDPAPGGHALDASAGSPVIVLHSSLVAGGTGGDGTLACPDTRNDGLPLFPVSEPKQELEGAYFALLAPALVREGDPLVLSLGGPPGALALLLVGSQPLVLLAPAKSGALLVVPQAILASAAVPASGVLNLDETVPGLPAGVEGLPVLLQSAFIAPTGAALGDASLVLLLDDAF